MTRKNDMHMKEIEGKSVAAERFIRTLKNKTYNHMTSISKNMYINELDDIVNKCNNAYHITIKMKLVDISQVHILISIKTLTNKILNLVYNKLVTMQECQNIKTFLQNVTFQIGLKKILLLQKLKILFRRHMLLVILKVRKCLKCFTKKNCKKQTKSNSG